MSKPKILVLDVETSPNLVWTWGLFKQDVSLDQIEEPSRMICWAAKWMGESGTHFGAEWLDGRLLLDLYELLSEADAICHYNGETFDWPIIKREFKEAGLDPLPEPQQVDLLRTIKKFRLASAKLDWAALRFLGERKIKTSFTLWLDVLGGKATAQNKMERYNRRDVLLTERLLKSVWPHVNELPNAALFSPSTDIDAIVCPRCGSGHVQRRGFKRTKVSAFPRFQCQKCHGWFQRTTREFGTRVKAI